MNNKLFNIYFSELQPKYIKRPHFMDKWLGPVVIISILALIMKIGAEALVMYILK